MLCLRAFFSAADKHKQLDDCFVKLGDCQLEDLNRYKVHAG